MTATGARIAAVSTSDSDTTQALLAALVTGWKAAGVKVAGLLAEPHQLPGRTCRAGTLRDITSARTFPIFQEAAPVGTSCHIDPAAVETACGAVLASIPSSDLVVLSKFGKLEAAGLGLTAAFRTAIAHGIPILTTVSEHTALPGRHLLPAHFFCLQIKPPSAAGGAGTRRNPRQSKSR